MARWLTDAGCDRLQGYWISPALGREALVDFVAAHEPGKFRLRGGPADEAPPPMPAEGGCAIARQVMAR